MEIEAFDIDGVLASFDVQRLQACDSYAEKYVYYWTRQPIRATESLPHKVIAITARDPVFKGLTETWLRKHYPGIDFDVYCVGYDKWSAERKVQVMQTLKVTRFYDDHAEWCEFYRQHGINAIHVKEVKQ